MRIFAMVGLCVLLAGCTNDRISSRLASWQGSHFSDVSAVWGAPDECSVGEPQQLCEWHVGPAILSATPQSVERRSCTTTLAFDSDGYVIGWRWRGDRCEQHSAVVAANLTRERPDALSIQSASDTVAGASAEISP